MFVCVSSPLLKRSPVLDLGNSVFVFVQIHKRRELSLMNFVTTWRKTRSAKMQQGFKVSLVFLFCGCWLNFSVVQALLDSNINTLRYDGEVNIGKKEPKPSINMFFFNGPIFIGCMTSSL